MAPPAGKRGKQRQPPTRDPRSSAQDETLAKKRRSKSPDPPTSLRAAGSASLSLPQIYTGTPPPFIGDPFARDKSDSPVEDTESGGNRNYEGDRVLLGIMDGHKRPQGSISPSTVASDRESYIPGFTPEPPSGSASRAASSTREKRRSPDGRSTHQQSSSELSRKRHSTEPPSPSTLAGSPPPDPRESSISKGSQLHRGALFSLRQLKNYDLGVGAAREKRIGW